MKKTLMAIYFLTVCIYSKAQTNEEIISSFKIKVDQIDSLFSTSPIIMPNMEYKNSGSGSSYCLLRIEKLKLAYDVKSTTSLISPYTAYIDIIVRVTSNEYGGNVKIKLSTISIPIGYETAEQALANTNFTPCVKDKNPETWCTGNVKINYAFQDGKWVYSSIDMDAGYSIKYGSARSGIEKEMPKLITSIK